MSDAWTPSRELESLAAAAGRGELTAEQFAALQDMLRDKRCRWYRDFFLLETELRMLATADRADAAARKSVRREAECMPVVRPIPSVETAWSLFSQDVLIPYGVAGVLVGVGLLIGSLVPVSSPPEKVAASATAPPVRQTMASHVARITGLVDCRWGTEGLGIRDWGLEKGAGDAGRGAGERRIQSLIPNPQSLVCLGDAFVLSSGLMEITYNTGAKVLLQGPVTYEVESASGGYLSVGKLTAKLEKGSGFRVQGSGRVASG